MMPSDKTSAFFLGLQVSEQDGGEGAERLSGAARRAQGAAGA